MMEIRQTAEGKGVIKIRQEFCKIRKQQSIHCNANVNVPNVKYLGPHTLLKMNKPCKLFLGLALTYTILLETWSHSSSNTKTEMVPYKLSVTSALCRKCIKCLSQGADLGLLSARFDLNASQNNRIHLSIWRQSSLESIQGLNLQGRNWLHF